jgi:ABC-2 type transport system permease protein
MKLPLLFVDELRGFYRSKVMVFLWIGMPIITLIFRYISLSSTGQSIPFTVVSTIVVSSLAGTLASVMLGVSIINEKSRHVYELFLIRPLKRRDLLLSKFLSVYVCIAVASLISILVGMLADYVTVGALSGTVLNSTAQSLATSLSMVAVSCSAGLLIGVAAPSVLVGAILILYGGNQTTVIPLVPTLLNLSDPVPFTIALGTAACIVLLATAFAWFGRSQF